MRRGGLAAGVFIAYLPQGRRTPEDEVRAFDQAMAMLAAIRAMARESDPEVRVATTVAEIEAAKRAGALAVIPAVENGYAIGRGPPASAACANWARATSRLPITATTRWPTPRSPAPTSATRRPSTAAFPRSGARRSPS